VADRVVEALALRAWALRVLSEGWAGPPEVGAPAWRLFLRAERCALPLSTRAEGEAPVLLHAAATVELQRVLSARAQLERLGRLATREGRRALVLKGGLLALTEGAVDLVDVDVLAEPGAAPALAALLDAGGYRAVGPEGPHHLAERAEAFAVQIEVHHSVKEIPAEELWSGARALDAWPGLWRAAPANVTWHALAHSTLSHPFRRAALRDLLLIGWADGQCGPGDHALLDARVRGSAGREALERVLGLARAIRDGTASADRCRREAAAHYLLLALPRALGPAVARSVFASLDGPDARRAYWRTVWRPPVVGSYWPPLARFERRWPAAGRGIRWLLRLARLPAVEAVAGVVRVRLRGLVGQTEADAARTDASRSGAP